MVQPDDVKFADRQEIEIVDDSDVEMVHDILGAALNVFRSGFIWRDAVIEEARRPDRGVAGSASGSTRIAIACLPRSKGSKSISWSSKTKTGSCAPGSRLISRPEGNKS